MNTITTTVALLLAFCGCERVHKHIETIKVTGVEKMVETHGNEKNFYTEIYWLITTDKGAFYAVPSGLWACPEASNFKPDSTYTVTIDGFYKSTFLGIYPYITEIK
ncbi:MAG: hypothetical protein NC248_12305 [Bacteroides sp.]|nr:hypothetical protein [Bacteroides sp.]MCM1391110.1 hypothetical protein [Bacteroides sp.]